MKKYNHLFVDGNKRIPLACLFRFLEINNIWLKISFKQLIKFVLDIESKKSVFKKNSLLAKTTLCQDCLISRTNIILKK